MSRSRKIFQHLLLLFFLIIVGSIFYLLGSSFRDDRYYDTTIVASIEIALFLCIPSYILYLIISKLIGANKNILTSSMISILSFGIVFLLVSFFAPYGADYKSRHVIISMLAFAFTALNLPVLEKIIIKSNK